MKVSSIDTIRIEEFPNLLFVEIKTDEGLVGLGETFYGPMSSEAHIHEIIAPYLLGKNPLNIEMHQKELPFLLLCCSYFFRYIAKSNHKIPCTKNS